MYKSVSFNIFEENLEEIIYGENSLLPAEDDRSNEKTVIVVGEITVPKITAPDSETKTFRHFGWERNGTLNVL